MPKTQRKRRRRRRRTRRKYGAANGRHVDPEATPGYDPILAQCLKEEEDRFFAEIGANESTPQQKVIHKANEDSCYRAARARDHNPAKRGGRKTKRQRRKRRRRTRKRRRRTRKRRRRRKRH
jgi:hypothetical protein